MNNKLSMVVPFEGFYESNAMARIDWAIQTFFSETETGLELDVPSNLYSELDIREIFKVYCLLYLTNFNQVLNEELDINIELVYEDLVSPRDYNFTTDTLYATISLNDAITLSSVIPSEIMADTVKEHCTSYDGFRSFYSNDFYDDNWQRHLSKHDHNELGMMLTAFSDREWKDGIPEHELFELNYAYEALDNHVHNMLYDLGYDITEDNQITKNGKIINKRA